MTKNEEIEATNKATLAKLPEFVSHKTVQAAVIVSVNPELGEKGETTGHWAMVLATKPKPTTLFVSDAWLAKHSPVEGGYLVAYADGYTSYSPAKAFVEGYQAK